MWCILYICVLSIVSAHKIVSITPVKYLKPQNPALPYMSRYQWKARVIPKIIEYVPPDVTNTISNSFSNDIVTDKSLKLQHVIKLWREERMNDYFNYLSNIREEIMNSKPKIKATKIDLAKFKVNLNKELEQMDEKINLTNDGDKTTKNETNFVNNTNIIKAKVPVINTTNIDNLTNNTVTTEKVVLKKTDKNETSNKPIEISYLFPLEVQKKSSTIKHKHKVNNINKNLTKFNDNIKIIFNTTKEPENFINLSQIIKSSGNSDLTKFVAKDSFDLPMMKTKKIDVFNNYKLTAAFPHLLSSKLDKVHDFVTPIKGNRIEDIKKVLYRNVNKLHYLKEQQINKNNTSINNATVSISNSNANLTNSTYIRKTREIKKPMLRKIFKKKSSKYFAITKRSTLPETSGSSTSLPNVTGAILNVTEKFNQSLSVLPLDSNDPVHLQERLWDYATSVIVRNSRDLKKERKRNKAGIAIRSKSVKRQDQMGQLGVEFVKYGTPFDAVNTANYHNESKPIHEEEENIDKLYELMENEGSLKDIVKTIDTFIGIKEMIFGSNYSNKGPAYETIPGTAYPKLDTEKKEERKKGKAKNKKGILSAMFPKSVESEPFNRGAGPSMRPRRRNGEDYLMHKNLHFCLIDKFNELTRSKRKAEIQDEDLPYNFLQLQPNNGIEDDNGNVHILSEMLEQAEIKPEIDVEKIIDAVQGELHAYQNIKYDNTARKHSHTYVRKHGNGVHPYHSHIAKMLWDKPPKDDDNINPIFDIEPTSSPNVEIRRNVDLLNAVDSDLDTDYLDNKEILGNVTDKKFDYDDFIITTKQPKIKYYKKTTTRKYNPDSPSAKVVIDMYDTGVGEFDHDITKTKVTTQNYTTTKSSTTTTVKAEPKTEYTDAAQADLEYFKEANHVHENIAYNSRGDFSLIGHEPTPFVPRASNVFLINTNKSKKSKLDNKLMRQDWNKFNEKLHNSPHNVKQKFPYSIDPIEEELRKNVKGKTTSNKGSLSKRFKLSKKSKNAKPKPLQWTVDTTTEKRVPAEKTKKSESNLSKLYHDADVHINDISSDYVESIDATLHKDYKSELPLKINSETSVKPTDISNTTFPYNAFENLSAPNRTTTTEPVLRISDSRLSEFDNFVHGPRLPPNTEACVDKENLKTGNKNLLGVWTKKVAKTSDNQIVASIGPMQLWHHKGIHTSPKKLIEDMSYLDDDDDDGFVRSKRDLHVTDLVKNAAIRKAVETPNEILDLKMGKKLYNIVPKKVNDVDKPEYKEHVLAGSNKSISEEIYSKNDSRSSESTFKRPRILCCVLKRADQTDIVKHIRATWGKRCDTLLFLSSKRAERSASWEYIKSALRVVHDMHLHRAEWFVKADVESYFIVENLRMVLKQYDHEKPLHFGRDDKKAFVLSKAALTSIVKKSVAFEECNADLMKGIRNCLSAIGVKSVMPMDSFDRPLFYPFSPFDIFAPVEHNPFERFNTWSDYAVSFQGVDMQDLYAIEYFVYKVRPYALSRSILTKLPKKVTSSELPIPNDAVSATIDINVKEEKDTKISVTEPDITKSGVKYNFQNSIRNDLEAVRKAMEFDGKDTDVDDITESHFMKFRNFLDDFKYNATLKPRTKWVAKLDLSNSLV